MSSFTSIYESIIHHPPPSTSEPLLIFLITGNPGLVSYYNLFLSLLASHCSSLPVQAHIYSVSLAGFSISGSAAEQLTHPLDLEGQISFIEGAVDKAREDVWRHLGRKEGEEGLRTVLMGHSIGGFMLLEVLRRRKERGMTKGDGIRVIGGVLLTPTVVDLRGSPSGKKVFVCFSFVREVIGCMTTDHIQHLGSQPYFASTFNTLAKTVLWPIPDAPLLRIIKSITGMPDDPANTTLKFLRSPMGIHQAIHLLRFELAAMTTDKWDDEIWGVTTADEKRANCTKTKLFFYFAQEDHWVAKHSRDQLIAARASTGKPDEEGRPRMEIDTTGIAHAFCLSEYLRYNQPHSSHADVAQNKVNQSQRRLSSTSKRS